MADIILSDGKEITFDLSKMTYGQYQGLFDKEEAEEKSDETIFRVAGITAEEAKTFSFVDYRRLIDAFFRKTREPLSDPN